MSVVQFQCPACQAPLRLENRALFVGRTFDCPDCNESLLIEADGSTGVTAKRSNTLARSVSQGTDTSAVTPSLARRANGEATSKVSDLGVDLQGPTSAWDRLSRRPALLGWIVAALFALVVLATVNSGRDSERPPATMPIIAESTSTKATSREPTQPDKAAEPPSKTNTEPDPRPAEVETAKVDVKPDPPRDDKPMIEPARAVEPPLTEPPKPLAVPPAPAPPGLSPEAIEAKLRQKIARFEQTKPVAFVKLLDTVEELAGVAMVWDLDRVSDEQLQKPVTLHLQQTTVGEILDTLLKQVGLERRTVDGKIELRPPSPKKDATQREASDCR